MIVLDTNVISELMRAKPHPAVLAWVAAQPRATLYTTSINQTEILYGIAMLPAGRRRNALAAAAEAMFAEDLAGRVLPYDRAAAARYAEIVVARRRVGNPIEAFDALIAATALTAGTSLATCDLGGFDGCGLMLIDPWVSS
ncbi:MAG: PIN domain-containing protein [Stellaceae bacterium]